MYSKPVSALTQSPLSSSTCMDSNFRWRPCTQFMTGLATEQRQWQSSSNVCC